MDTTQRQRCKARGHLRRTVLFLPESKPTRRVERCDLCGATLARERLQFIEDATDVAPALPIAKVA